MPPQRGSVKGWQRADINSAAPPPKRRSDQLDYSGPADVKAQVSGGDDETFVRSLGFDVDVIDKDAKLPLIPGIMVKN
ncbi:hypothetical protein ACO1O0_002824 [Amphichorda felina]